jgi:hypothetical protein
LANKQPLYCFEIQNDGEKDRENPFSIYDNYVNPEGKNQQMDPLGINNLDENIIWNYTIFAYGKIYVVYKKKCLYSLQWG